MAQPRVVWLVNVSMVSCFAFMLFGSLRNVCLQLVCMVDELRGWLFG